MLAAHASPAEVDAARAFLAAHGEMSRTPVDFRTAVVALATFRHFAPGEDLIRVDTSDGHIFTLVRGAAALTTALGATDTRVSHMLHSGDWFGYVQLFTGDRRNGTITARSACLVGTIARPALDRLLAAHPGWWQHIGHLSARNANTATSIAADLMIADSTRRCLATLLRLAGCRFGARAQLVPADGPPITALVNQEELGAVANLSRNSVNGILRAAEQRGLVTLGYNRIIVNDPDALRAIVDDL